MECLLDTTDLCHMSSVTCNPFAFANHAGRAWSRESIHMAQSRKKPVVETQGTVSKQGIRNHHSILRDLSCQIKVRTAPFTQTQTDRQDLSFSSQLNQRLTRSSKSFRLSSDPGWVGRFAFPFVVALALTLAALLTFTFGFAFTMVPKCQSIFHSRTFGMHRKMIWQLLTNQIAHPTRHVVLKTVDEGQRAVNVGSALGIDGVMLD